MRTRILNYLRTQHLGLLALVLVVGGSTAYAAGLAKDSVKSKQIKNGQVKSVDVKDQGLTGTDVADGTVGSADITDGSIGSVEILDGGVGSLEIATNAVDSAEIANDAVIGQKIATGVIGGGKLSPGAVNRNKIEDGAVDGTKVEDGTLSGADVADASIAGADVTDASIGQADLDPATVADVISKSSTMPADSTLRSVLTLTGFGTFSLSCNTVGPDITIRYEFEPGVPQTVTIVGRNTQGTASTTTTAATPANLLITTALTDGYILIDAGSRFARLDFTALIDGSNCPHSARATIDRDEP